MTCNSSNCSGLYDTANVASPNPAAVGDAVKSPFLFVTIPLHVQKAFIVASTLTLTRYQVHNYDTAVLRPIPQVKITSFTLDGIFPPLLGTNTQKPPTFRTVDIGDDGKNERGLSKEPIRPGPPQTGPGHMTNEVVTAKVNESN